MAAMSHQLSDRKRNVSESSLTQPFLFKKTSPTWKLLAVGYEKSSRSCKTSTGRRCPEECSRHLLTVQAVACVWLSASLRLEWICWGLGGNYLLAYPAAPRLRN